MSDFPAAKAVVVCTTKRLPVSGLKDRLPRSAQSNVIYSFVCTCGSRYVGRTGRSPGTRVKEHVPKWMLNSYSRPLPQSSVAHHLISSGCDVVDKRDRFTILFSSCHFMVLRLMESLTIKRLSRKYMCSERTRHSLIIALGSFHETLTTLVVY